MLVTNYDGWSISRGRGNKEGARRVSWKDERDMNLGWRMEGGKKTKLDTKVRKWRERGGYWLHNLLLHV